MLTGVRCRWLTPGKTTLVSVDDCRACALTGRNPCAYPAPIIFQVTVDRDPEVVRTSATMFSGCAREQAIKRHHAWMVDPQRAYTRAVGSLAHKGAEVTMDTRPDRGDKDKPSQFETERRYRREYTLPDGRVAVITAQLDVLIAEPDGSYIIQDYKIVDSVAPSKLARKVQGYVPQFSIQRWILDGLGKQVSSVDLHFMAHKTPRRVNLYPDGDAELPGASLFTLEETEMYFDATLPALLDGLEGGPEGIKMPPVIENPAEFWRCRYCDVADLCRRLYGKELPAFR